MYKFKAMLESEYNGIRPMYLRNLVILLDSGICFYNRGLKRWGLKDIQNPNFRLRRASSFRINYESISSEEILIDMVEDGKVLEMHILDSMYSLTSDNMKHFTDFNMDNEMISTLVERNLSSILEYVSRVCVYDGGFVMVDKTEFQETLLCLVIDSDEDEKELGDNILEIDIMDNNSFKDLSDHVEIGDIAEIDDVASGIKYIGGNNSSSVEYSKVYDNDGKVTIQMPIDFTRGGIVQDTFVSNDCVGGLEEEIKYDTPFDKVITYLIERGVLDRLQFSSTFVTLKSHIVIGQDIFVEAGISELSLKKNIIKIKHMVGDNLEETELSLGYVFDKIEKSDIYIRAFDMHRGKKIYTVKID